MQTEGVDTATLREKEEVKIPEKGAKAQKQNQQNIMMSIENEQIQNNVSDLVSKFDPPMCINCENRRVDRVCINKACGPVKYMQVICGKCHSETHSKAIKKPEIDIEEYFIKFSKFLNEQKYADKKAQAGRIDIDLLATTNEDLQNIRNKLLALKQKISFVIENYQSPEEKHSGIQDNIAKALSLCEHDNISYQLSEIKKRVIFQKNQFSWNDSGQKFDFFNLCFKDFEKYTIKSRKTISKSFLGSYQIDLNDHLFLPSSGINRGYNIGNTETETIWPKNEILTINGNENYQKQYYLNYKLDSTKKYKMRFCFGPNPQNYIMIGIITEDRVNNKWVFGIAQECFYKKFFNTSTSQECSRIIKGSDISTSPTAGYEIEMQVDFGNNYIDFTDYPTYNNVNANHLNQKMTPSQTYVLAIAIYQSQSISLTHFEEIFKIEEH